MTSKFDEHILDEMSETTQTALATYYKKGYKVYNVSYDGGTITVRLSNKDAGTFVITLTEYTH